MKITRNDLAALAALVSAVDTETVRTAYRAGDYPRAELTRDVNRRYRWDLYHAAIRADRDLQDRLCAYLDNNHIDTALRQIVPAL